MCGKKFPGEHGHIAIGTSDCERAMYYLNNSKGVDFDMETARFKNGKVTFVYLKGEIGGFAFHLVEK